MAVAEDDDEDDDEVAPADPAPRRGRGFSGHPLRCMDVLNRGHVEAGLEGRRKALLEPNVWLPCRR